MKETTGPKQILRLLFWESTIKCNLACAHCRRIDSDDTSYKDLSTEQGENLIEQLAALGKEQSMMPMLVFSGGEPLCRDDLFELISRAGELGIIPALATNGTMINPAAAERIRDSGIKRVSVSLDGATADVHDRLRQLPGSFEKALEGIGHLREQKVPFQINMTLTKHNAHQIEDVYNLAKSLGAVAVHIFMLVPVGCGRSLADTDMLSPEQYEQKMLEIYKLDSRGELQLKVTCGPHYERVIREQGLSTSIKTGRGGHSGTSRGCLAGLGVLFVGHQGDVFPCGYLPVRCGNVLEDKLSDIWYNNKDLVPRQGVRRYRKLYGGRAFLCIYATGGSSFG